MLSFVGNQFLYPDKNSHFNVAGRGCYRHKTISCHASDEINTSVNPYQRQSHKHSPVNDPYVLVTL